MPKKPILAPQAQKKAPAQHKRRKRLVSSLQLLLKKERATRNALNACYNWKKNARTSQQEPAGNWRIWLILAGRGYGKTRTGAETIRQWVEEGKAKRIALIGATLKEARNVMIEGASGLSTISPPWNLPKYNKESLQLVWPNGAQAQVFSACQPEKLRGPQFDAAWIDEFAKFPNPEEVWNQIQLSMRLGHTPRMIITTTPRPIPFLKKLLNHPDVTITRGSTFENTNNLSPSFLEALNKEYQGTPLGAQEIYAELLDADQGALWTRAIILYKSP